MARKKGIRRYGVLTKTSRNKGIPRNSRIRKRNKMIWKSKKEARGQENKEKIKESKYEARRTKRGIKREKGEKKKRNRKIWRT